MAQDRVAARVSVAVVHPFEVVDVHHEEAIAPAEERREVDFALDLLIEGRAIVDLRDRVDRGLFADAVEFVPKAGEACGHVADLCFVSIAPLRQVFGQQGHGLLGLVLDLVGFAALHRSLESPHPVPDSAIRILFDDEGATQAGDEGPGRLTKFAQGIPHILGFGFPVGDEGASQTRQIAFDVLLLAFPPPLTGARSGEGTPMSRWRAQASKCSSISSALLVPTSKACSPRTRSISAMKSRARSAGITSVASSSDPAVSISVSPAASPLAGTLGAAFFLRFPKSMASLSIGRAHDPRPTPIRIRGSV